MVLYKISYVHFLTYLKTNYIIGNDESATSHNKGLYVELLNLIGQYDNLIESHLMSNFSFKGTSNHIQNDLIEAVSAVLLSEIEKEISETPFLAIMVDEATDIVKMAQMSICFRYVTSRNEIVERFFTFLDVTTDRTAAAVSKIEIDLIEKHSWGDKLVAQGYDGASVMSGEVNGVQTKLREVFPLARFIHCSSHCLNLVLSQSIQFIIFFSTLCGLPAFFSPYSKRIAALDSIVNRRLPQLSRTRWNFSSQLVSVVENHRDDLIELFQMMVDNPDEWKNDAVTARGYMHFLNEFNTVFFLKSFV